MVSPISIDPSAIYDDASLALALDIPSGTVVRARRAGHLRYRRIGRRALFLGRWVIEWLTANTSCGESNAN
jgi:hypothetical protein